MRALARSIAEITQWRMTTLLLSVVVLFLSCALSATDAAESDRQRCITFDLSTLNRRSKQELFSAGFDSNSVYFCSNDAPEHLRCKCDVTEGCLTKRDRYGRDLGECGCCSAWAYTLIVMAPIAVILLILVLSCSMGLIQKGHWLIMGYPRRLSFGFMRLSVGTPAPPEMPLPGRVFSAYPPHDFVNVTEENADLDSSVRMVPQPPHHRWGFSSTIGAGGVSDREQSSRARSGMEAEQRSRRRIGMSPARRGRRSGSGSDSRDSPRQPIADREAAASRRNPMVAPGLGTEYTM